MKIPICRVLLSKWFGVLLVILVISTLATIRVWNSAEPVEPGSLEWYLRILAIFTGVALLANCLCEAVWVIKYRRTPPYYPETKTPSPCWLLLNWFARFSLAIIIIDNAIWGPPHPLAPGSLEWYLSFSMIPVGAAIVIYCIYRETRQSRELTLCCSKEKN